MSTTIIDEARAAVCIAACEGMRDPERDIRILKHDAARYEAIVNARHEPTDRGLGSLRICVSKTLGDWYGCGGGHRLAQVLSSLYNGDRVKANLWDALSSIDTDVFEHVLHVFRLHHSGGHEIHTYFNPGRPLHDPKLGADGNDIFERIIRDYRLEKRRRSRS